MAAGGGRSGETAGGSGGAGRVRVVFVSSMTHFGGGVRWSDLQWRQQYDAFQAYADSKLMDVLAAKEMQHRADRLAASDPSAQRISAVAVHPGIVNTGLAWGFFGNAAGPFQPLVAAVQRAMAPLLTRSPRAAAHVVLYAATAPDDEVAGQYVADGSVKKSSKLSYDPALARRLWDVSCQLASYEPTF